MSSFLPYLLGIDDVTRLDLRRAWAPRPVRDHLRVPIGTRADGGPLELDLKEHALGGAGPHGLIVGTTGSGKTELLHTIVLALAATHGPDTVNVVLVDHRVRDVFRPLDRLPHTAAEITELFGDPALMDGLTDALTGELTRRQDLLRTAGNHASRQAYERARLAGAPLEPMPSLLVVCNEFTELLTERPDVIETFIHVGRLGRTLGVHLLLATQRLDEGRLRGLDTYLSYRIALRMYSRQESQRLLGIDDAADLPTEPGHGYLRTGGATVRFRSVRVTREPLWRTDHPPAYDSVEDVLVAQMAGRGRPARRLR